MLEFRNQYLQTNDQEERLQIYNKMNTYTKNLSVPDQNRKKTLIDPVAAISEGALAETSDDTRELKRRPNK
ncbi:unnamed protein product [Rhizophagus irregularis]|nr:unnamed protein product [Rhizophagus irregularis]